ncbi:MAG: isoleucine--tRNA ligase [Actinobacteria bacterium]|nr:isoleucine--tRNA ligase [Actinomycetota bacterium]
MYRAVPPHVDLPALEHGVLDLWQRERIFERSLEKTADGPRWIFYEGPPTANGMPGTHHVEARVFKDVFPRYRTMKGYHVPRRAGWDCHGLPVELAVEKELGFSGKQDIEKYGVAEFNAKCRESVERHVDAFEAMTERMGYWVDMKQAYRTMDATYLESVWWSLKTIFDKGLLVQDHRVAPYCPRCGTGLSDHELAQGYETVIDPSVYVRFPVAAGPLKDAHGDLALAVWTTTPWTLVSNTAVAVNPDVTYVVARTFAGEQLIIAEQLVTAVAGDDAVEVARYSGRDLEHTPYIRPFDLVEIPDSHYVVLADYVTTEDGTGLVHLAPAFGADDLAATKVYGLPVVNPVRPDGHFESSVPLVGDVFFKDADEALVNDLRDRGLLLKHLPYEHSYPHCWRCHTPLIYYAQMSWYIRTTTIKDDLLRENDKTNWFPPTIQWGRYGDWLRNNIDYAVSRSRYWGTPLPMWINDEDPTQMVVVGSLAELGELAGTELSTLDPHRPFVDDITFTKPGIPGTFRRVPEVIDCWYDSGAMPFAQWGAPHRNNEEFQASYPADFIAEAIDQTRGWFYTLMAVGTLVFDQSAYKNVVCLGHILDDQGRKMSKHLGNVLEPIPLMDEYGADAVRWFMAAGGSPWQARRVGHSTMQETVRKVLLTYWNTVSFQSLYARTAGWSYDPSTVTPAAERDVLDRWVLSLVNRLAADVDDALENFDTQRAGRLIAECVDALSNWYVRRSRRRFWDGDNDALSTLHEALRIVTLVMAPFTPFITEQVWHDLFTADDSDSVHLQSWPEVEPALISDQLESHMDTVRRVVELGRAARAESGVKTRQPLGRALVAAPDWAAMEPALHEQVAAELNVMEVTSLDGVDTDLVDISVKANFRELGKRFGKRTPTVAQAIADADAVALTSALRIGPSTITVEGSEEAISLDDVIITESPREGWAVASEDGASCALDLTLTDELLAAGRVREAIRAIQEGRKNLGFDVSDRIALVWWSDDQDTIAAIEGGKQLLASEVLATSIGQADDAPVNGTACVELNAVFEIIKSSMN